MNLQQASQPRTSANGYGRRRHERDGGGAGAGGGARPDHYRSQSSKSSSNKPSQAGPPPVGGRIGGPSGDRLVYLAACLIGHQVEVQVKNGSVYSGIFHATNADKDFGIILKMAYMTRDGSGKGQRADAESLSKAPQKMLIIPAKELVQVIAKDVPVTSDGLNQLQNEKQHELMLDSYISQSRHVDLERVLEPWVPDEDDPQCPELENIFDGHWNRNWDQFATNATLFGVKSTFDEEIYTTKLEKGPRMKELEKEASRIAREIEGEVTQDLHLAEERGLQLQEFDVDEETRFSSVYRGKPADDSGYDEDEDILFNSRNTDTFGDSIAQTRSGLSSGLTSAKSSGLVPPSSSLKAEDTQTSRFAPETDIDTVSALHNSRQPSSENFASTVTEKRLQESSIDLAVDKDSQVQTLRHRLDGVAQVLQTEDTGSSTGGKKDASYKGVSSSNAAARIPPSEVSYKDQEDRRPKDEQVEGTMSGKRIQLESHSTGSNQRPGSSRSSISDHVGATSASTRAGLTPSSSMGSLSSEKSTLNPNAKEFKLNPNAKSFVPSQSPVRSPSPVSDASFYVPSNVAAVSHMHGMPGVGIGPSYVGPQPVIYNPQFAPMHSPQGYIQPNAPPYGQQVFFGHPRQVPYMSTYPPEMPYKGRDY